LKRLIKREGKTDGRRRGDEVKRGNDGRTKEKIKQEVDVQWGRKDEGARHTTAGSKSCVSTS
jgi:hypothetical protein